MKNKDITIFRFAKDHDEFGRDFKKGMYIELQNKLYSGDFNGMLFKNWIQRLLKSKIINYDKNL